MGKVKRADEPGPGRSNECKKKSINVRPKREQRTNLDELHRNVLETKRNLRLRAPNQHKRSKTSLTKVLTDFAERRRENEEDVDNVIGPGRGRRTKPRIICDRLLPEPMVGLYKNGSKGREIHRVDECLNEKNVARLRNDVMKLLNGDETNPKERGTIETRRGKRTKRLKPSAVRLLDKNKGSDSEIEIGRLIVKDASSDSSVVIKSSTQTETSTVVKNKTIGNFRRIERKRERINDGNDEIAKTKDQRIKVIRRKDEEKFKRRLFEPDDEDETAKNSFGIIDRPRIMEEIRFSSSKKTSAVTAFTVAQLKSAKNNGTKGFAKQAETSNKLKNDNICGLPPVFCYENFCGMMCINHFENKRHRYKVSDRTVNIQKQLKGFYLGNRRKMAIIKESADERKIDKKIIPLIGTSAENSEEMEEDSTDESAIMIGSWHPDIKETNSEKRTKDNPPEVATKLETPSTVDSVQKTISSVSLFLKKFEQNSLMKRVEKKLSTHLLKSPEKLEDKEKSNDNLNVPFSDLMKFDLSLNTLTRKCKKHVPTILRRSNSRSGRVEKFEKKSWLFPRVSIDKQTVKKVSEKLPSNRLVPLRPLLPENRSLIEMNLSPISVCTLSPISSTTTILYSDHRDQQGRREINENILDNERRNVERGELNFVEGNYRLKRKFVSEGDDVSKTSEATGYEGDVSDNIRGSIEETLQDRFVNRVNMENYETAIKRRSECWDRTENQNRMNFLTHPQRESTERKDKSLFNEPDRFFKKNDYNDKINASIQPQRLRDNFENRPRAAIQSSLEFQQLPNYQSYTGHIDDRYEKYSTRYNEKTKDSSLLHDDKNLPTASPSRIVTNNWQESTSRPVKQFFLANYPSRDTPMELTNERCAETRKSKISNQPSQSEKSIQSLHSFLANKDLSRINGHLESECIFLGCDPSEEKRDINKAVLPYIPNVDSYAELISLREEIAKYKSLGFSYKNPQDYSFRLNGFHYVYFPRLRIKLSNQSLSRCDWKILENSQTSHEREIFHDSQPTKFLAFKQNVNCSNPPTRIPMYANVETITVDSIGLDDGKILKSDIVDNQSRDKVNKIIHLRPHEHNYQIGRNVREETTNKSLNEKIDDNRIYEYQALNNFHGKRTAVFSNYSNIDENPRVSNCSQNCHQTFNENVSSSQETSQKFRTKNVPKIIFTTNSQGIATRIEESRHKMESSQEQNKIGPTRVYQPQYIIETNIRGESSKSAEQNLRNIIQLPDGRIGFVIDKSLSKYPGHHDDLNPRETSNHLTMIERTKSINPGQMRHDDYHNSHHQQLMRVARSYPTLT